jgi:hypothetical protein
MSAADFRSCPFCASSDLVVARTTDGKNSTLAVVCLECGASGPKGSDADPPGHVEFMWNQRYGADH